MPAFESPAVYGDTGFSSGYPVIQVSPAASSMTKANAGSSRHGPSRPKPGIRTTTRSGRAARTASTSSPICSSTRGV